jgi:hypothetical protein
VVLYVFKTRPLTLKEEYRVRVFENRVLRRIFGPKRDEVTEVRWRKPHNKELHNFSSWSSVIIMIKSRSMGLAEHVALMRIRIMHIGSW